MLPVSSKTEKVLSQCVREVELGQSRATRMRFTTCFCEQGIPGNSIPVPWQDMEKPCATVSFPDLVVLPITRWLHCDFMVKLFGDHNHVACYDISSGWQELPKWFSVGAAPGQNLCGLLADSGFAACNWSSHCCRSLESEYCNPGGYSGY